MQNESMTIKNCQGKREHFQIESESDRKDGELVGGRITHDALRETRQLNSDPTRKTPLRPTHPLLL